MLVLLSSEKFRLLFAENHMPRPRKAEDEPVLDIEKVDRRLPAREQAYQVLRSAIISTAIAPGTMISENKICAVIGASRTPVRDAILRLSEEGLVEVYPQRGSNVAPINLSRVYEGHFVRRSLELAVIREAAKKWTKADTKKVKEIIAAQRRSKDIAEIHRLDDQFHEYFCKVAGFENIWHTIQSAKSHLDRVRHLAVPERGNQKSVIAEHSRVLDALDAGDVRAAVKYHREHLDTVYETVERLAEKHDDIFSDRDIA